VKRGKLIVIVAPSGTGKSTLIEKLKKEISSLDWSISYTTRLPRPGEVNGQDYFFITQEKFEKMIEADAFVEWAKVHGNFYGTTKEFVSTGLVNGRHLLFDLDVQGCDSMKNHFGSEANVIFICPPSIEELARRLRSRATESNETIELRINNAKKELKRSDDFDFKVINDEVSIAYSELKKIVIAILEGSA